MNQTKYNLHNQAQPPQPCVWLMPFRYTMQQTNQSAEQTIILPFSMSLFRVLLDHIGIGYLCHPLYPLKYSKWRVGSISEVHVLASRIYVTYLPCDFIYTNP